MEQQDFQKEMERIEKSNKWKNRKPFIILGGLVVLLIAYINISKYIKKNEDEKAKNQADKVSFIEDSVWLVDVLRTNTPDKIFAGQLVALERRISYNRYASESSKSHLLTILDSLKVKVDTGTIFYDEFDMTTVIKKRTKSIIVNFDDFDKYDVKNVYKGYANNINRKAFKLLQENPSWEKQQCITIASGKVNIGMTSDMVRKAWGSPRDINRTVGSWGVHEQWVYGGSYLYFENGKLTSWQD